MDPFAVLGLPRTYDLDLAAAEKTHRELSRALHPDRYVNAGASERRDALSRAADVNEAWRIVRDPIRRAEALFALAGVKVGERSEPPPSPDLLMDVMEKREALAEARASKDASAVRALADEMETRAKETERALADGFEKGNGAVSGLVPRLGELRFYRRFLEEVSAIEEDL
jgi:molecular chaperone HscB